MPEFCLLINSCDDIQKQLAAWSNFLGHCSFAAPADSVHSQNYKAEEQSVRHVRQGEVHL